MASSSSDGTCTLKLLVEANLAKAIIGTGGSAVRRIRAESGVHSIHLSSNAPGVVERTCSIVGPLAAVRAAFLLIAATLRAEARLDRSQPEVIRALVPDGASLVGEAALAALRRASGACIEATAAPCPSRSAAGAATKEKLLTYTGNPEQTAAAVEALLRRVASRHEARHRDFFKNWSFETDYSDHFETPERAYQDVAPLLLAVACERASLHSGPPRKRARTAVDGAVAVAAGGAARLEAEAAALLRLVVYDPYFCQGAMRAALASAAALSPSNVINENRDFYQYVAAGAVPPHDALVSNPPYSGEHKQKLFAHLLAEWRRAAAAASSGGGRAEGAAGRPFLLLLPAWLAATDLWQSFVRDAAGLCRGAAETAPASAEEGTAEEGTAEEGTAEARAGIFYVCPAERYEFHHPQATGHASSPFHAVWFCGGWVRDADRRRAMRRLKARRGAGHLEVFRSARMLQRRGHFEKGAAARAP